MDGAHPSGGSLELARLIDEYGEHLVPDLQHYYGIDLRDLFSEDGLDPRWLLTHVWNLPMESAFNAAQRGGIQFRGWDEGRYLQARLYDAMNMVAYILVMVNRDPDKRAPDAPKPYPTPSIKPVLTGDIPDQNFKPGSFGAVLRQAKIAKLERLELEAANAGSGQDLDQGHP